MTLCTNCQSKIPSLRARKQAVNADLHKLGLTYHDNLPLYQIDNILKAHDFNPLCEGLRDQRAHEHVGEGLWLTASFYRMESGRWEVVAYVNG